MYKLWILLPDIIYAGESEIAYAGEVFSASFLAKNTLNYLLGTLGLHGCYYWEPWVHAVKSLYF